MKKQILIDTHIFLWLFLEPERFSKAAINFVKDQKDNQFYLSHASSWEISIKFGVGKLKLPKPPEFFVPQRMQRAGYLHLPIELEHVLSVHLLPKIHSDPFDRLIVSQAIQEKMTVLTADPIFLKYNVDLLKFSDIC
ncbi:MAG: type II toxin-antitoxin system VapC family toxin [Saprospiraceae bacterium]|nr:type II toxin-antitoxin system VapC family toxin [Pyrinomonadaceae bacterium]